MDESTPCKLEGWSDMLLNGIPRYFEANLCVISSREFVRDKNIVSLENKKQIYDEK